MLKNRNVNIYYMKNNFIYCCLLAVLAISCTADPCEEVDNIECETGDVDGDGILNLEDIAPSDPCSPDEDHLNCSIGDFDKDGIPNAEDKYPSDPCRPIDNLACITGDLDNDGITNENDTHPENSCLPFDNLSCLDGDVDNDGITNNEDPFPLDQCAPLTPPISKIILGRWKWKIDSFEGVIFFDEDGNYTDLTGELLETGGNFTSKTWNIDDKNTILLLIDHQFGMDLDVISLSCEAIVFKWYNSELKFTRL